MQVPLPGARTEVVNVATEWFTREEENAFALEQAGHGIPSIARELRVSHDEAQLVLARHSARATRMFGRPMSDS